MADYVVTDGWAVRRGHLAAKKSVLLDLDSTVADTRHRSHLTPHNQPGTTWDDYSMHCADDTPITGVVTLVAALAVQHKIRVVSGRSIRALPLTVTWLNEHGVAWDMIRLRGQDDSEDNVAYKASVLEEIPSWEQVVLGIDDWPPVISMWADHGIPGLCVNPMYSDDANAYFTKADTTS